MPAVIVCPACDLAHRRGAPPARGRNECVRCHASLQRPQNRPVETAIALGVCALVLLILGNVYPLVVMHVNGASRETTLVGAALGLYDQDYKTLAGLVLLTTVIAPLSQILALLYLLIPLWRRRRAPGQSAVFRLLLAVRRWSFMEVFMLGALVALVRLSNYAHVLPGIALWSCALLMISLSALTSVTSPEQFWAWVEQRAS
jgi:paraquat-inducible protein A